MKSLVQQLAIVLTIGLTAVAVAAQDSERQIRGGILNGKATSLPKPEYPAEAKSAGLEGMVFVDVVIDEEGNVISAAAATEPRETIKPNSGGELIEVPVADPVLREVSERAALRAKFSRTRLSGEPVKVSGTIIYNFVAKGDESNINGGVLNGKAINLPIPAYPEVAHHVRAQGPVMVQVTIDEGGTVISATAVSGHPLLRASAVEAARAALFSPTLLEGRPVKVTGVLTYNFVAPKID